MDDAKRKLAVIVGLCEHFGRELGNDATRMYLEAIDDVPAAEVERAGGQALRECEFFPVPAVLRRLSGRAAPSLDDLAIRAWEVAWKAVHEVGAYRTVTFADRVTARTIAAMGGWTAFCRPEQEEQWHRRQFLETYRSLVNAPDDGEPATLTGEHDRTSIGRRQQPVLIGGGDGPKQLPPGGGAGRAPVTKGDAMRLIGEIMERATGDPEGRDRRLT